MSGVAPQDMSVIGCTASFGRIVYTYEGDGIAGAQAQNTTNRRVKGKYTSWSAWHASNKARSFGWLPRRVDRMSLCPNNGRRRNRAVDPRIQELVD